MMKKRHILHWAIGVILTPLLGSCAADDIGDAGREGCDIILGQPITVTSATRATDGRTSSTQFEKDEIVWMWALKDGTTTEHITAWKLKADNSGGFSSATIGTDKYWPSDGKYLNVYALHGNFENTQITEGSPSWSSLTPLIHTVKTDQTSDENKRLSDLLYSQTSSAVAPNNTVQLTFDHVLSKICITLKKADGSGIEDANLKDAKVEVSGINTEVTYDATNNRVTNSGTASTITLGQETSGSTTYEAIVPSNMTVNNPHVTITLNDFPASGKTRTFSCTLSRVTFAKGNKYTFTLTLHNNIVVSQPTIKGWTNDEATDMTIPQAEPS